MNLKQVLKAEQEKPYYAELQAFLNAETAKGTVIYPPENLRFTAIELTPTPKVIILGQDPYHGEENGKPQAHGLAFSVKCEKLPPSLKNIYKELKAEYPEEYAIQVNSKLGPQNGDLCDWARAGVLLLNTVLTVEKGKPNSHKNKGWEILTDNILKALIADVKPKVFLLWGEFAKGLIKLPEKSPEKSYPNLFLTAPHPSPFSAHKGFFGCGHFKTANEFLVSTGQEPINWISVC
jgi:uracil-DNA glycosylase